MNGAGTPGTLPCSCLHGWEYHQADYLHACEICGPEKCASYNPIPRSEARRREFEQGRTEMAAKADAANKSELKSQAFPTSTEPGHRFWVDQAHGLDRILSAIAPFGIAVGEHPVVDNGPLETPPAARYMTYKTRTGAENGLARARLELNEARIAEHGS